MAIDIDVSSLNGVPVVYLSGEIDIYNTPALRNVLLKVIDGSTGNVAVCLEKVSYIDSTGIGTLLFALNRIKKKDATLLLYKVSPTVGKVMQYSNLTKIFRICKNEQELTNV